MFKLPDDATVMLKPKLADFMISSRMDMPEIRLINIYPLSARRTPPLRQGMNCVPNLTKSRTGK